MSQILSYFDSGGGGSNVQTLTGNTGVATAVANNIDVLGGRNISTTGAGDTLTIDLESLTDGQLLIGNTGNPATAATLTAGAGITITNGAGSISIAATESVTAWTVVAASQGMAVDNGYVANGGALVTLTLPAVAAVGDYVRITGLGAGLFRVAQNAGQSINFVSATTTIGVGGSLTAIEQFDSIEIVCVVANTTFSVLSSTGNFTVV